MSKVQRVTQCVNAVGGLEIFRAVSDLLKEQSDSEGGKLDLEAARALAESMGGNKEAVKGLVELFHTAE